MDHILITKIQDRLNTEYFPGLWKTTINGETNWKIGKYSDNMLEDIGDDHQEIFFDRACYYCVPIPGETDWVKEKLINDTSSASIDMAVQELQHTRRGVKRMRDDHDHETVQPFNNIEENLKKVKIDDPSAANSTTKSKVIDFNFPIPETEGQPIIVKVYDCDDMKFNEVIEFYGVLEQYSPEPIYTEGNLMWMSEEEMLVHHPPSSVISRLHAITHINLGEGNPIGIHEVSMEDVNLLECRMNIIQDLTSLTHDALLSEYLLCAMVSKVYSRVNAFTLGYFPVNIQVPHEFDKGSFGKVIEMALSRYLPKSVFIDVTLEKFNNEDFKLVPVQNHDSNRLQSGRLQLSNGTCVIIDETYLSSGTLNEHGLRNISALKYLCNFQKVTFDYGFHQIDFNTDYIMIIISASKSVILRENPACYNIKLENDADNDFLPISPELHKNIRKYIMYIRNMSPSELDGELAELVQDDFVNMRKANSDMQIGDLNMFLTLSRLLSISEGCQNTTKEHWERAKQLEGIRIERLSI
eukprot:TRINITY_DN7052_c0_g1_i2.p1 TRINITY_DN7052_c0_g1~~TRINITY_DN7052_c0_g1_i2.p1  ORF type:complete len:525 (-),score=106.93 TRINITY_DN7052_c0_g1_i2:1451-3025(-)